MPVQAPVAARTATLDAALASLTLSSNSPPVATRHARTPTPVSVTPWMNLLRRTEQDRSRAPIDLLDEEVMAFVTTVRPTKGEQRLRLNALDCFAKIIERLWPSAKIELFGSMATGLYLPHGDFDLVISDACLLQHTTASLLATLEAAVLESGFASSVRLVTGAKVPLVKLVTAPEFCSFAMDISFNSPKGPKGARESLRLLEELDERRKGDKLRAKTLVFLLKTLLDAKGLSEVRFGGLGGLGIFCLAVSFVQLDRRDPSRCSPARDLLDFLYRYGWTFDYRHDCIITAGGGRIVAKREMGFGRRSGGEGDRLSIQHPVDLARDLTSGTFEIEQLSACVGLDGLPPTELAPSESMLGRAGFTLAPEVVAQRSANQEVLDAEGLEQMAKEWVPAIDEAWRAWEWTARGGYRNGLTGAASTRGMVSPAAAASALARVGANNPSQDLFPGGYLPPVAHSQWALGHPSPGSVPSSPAAHAYYTQHSPHQFSGQYQQPRPPGYASPASPPSAAAPPPPGSPSSSSTYAAQVQAYNAAWHAHTASSASSPLVQPRGPQSSWHTPPAGAGASPYPIPPVPSPWPQSPGAHPAHSPLSYASR